MKKILFICLFLSSGALIQGCRYGIMSFSQDEVYGSSCPNPKYVTTMYYKGISKITQDENGFPAIDEIALPKDFTLSNILKMAKDKHGQDVTINNVRWDVIGRSRRRVGVIFDVIQCTAASSISKEGNSTEVNGENKNLSATLKVDGTQILFGDTLIATLSPLKYPKGWKTGDKGDLNVNFTNQDFLQKHRTEVSTILQTYYPAKNWNLVMVVTSQSIDSLGGIE